MPGPTIEGGAYSAFRIIASSETECRLGSYENRRTGTSLFMSSYIVTDPFQDAETSPLLRGDPYVGVSRILTRPPCAPGSWPPVEDAVPVPAGPLQEPIEPLG